MYVVDGPHKEDYELLNDFVVVVGALWVVHVGRQLQVLDRLLLDLEPVYLGPVAEEFYEDEADGLVHLKLHLLFLDCIKTPDNSLL